MGKHVMTAEEIMKTVELSTNTNTMLRYLPTWIWQQLELKKLQQSISNNEMLFSNDLDLITQLSEQCVPKKRLDLKDTSAAVFYAVPYQDTAYLVKVYKESFETKVKFELLGEVNI